MNPLTPEQLAPYFGTGLKLMKLSDPESSEPNVEIMTGLNSGVVMVNHDVLGWADVSEVKPILYSLDHFKGINSKQMMDLNLDIPNLIELNELADGRIGFWNVSYGTMRACFENHINCFGLTPDQYIDKATFKTT